MACKSCSCNDGVTTPAAYQIGTEACPAGERCATITDSECVVYNGDRLKDFPLEYGERVEVTLKKLILYHLDSAALFGDGTTHAPYNVESISIKDTEIEIEWDSVPSVVDYVVSIAPASTGVYVDATVSSLMTKYKFINLAPSTQYEIKVTANGIAGSYTSLVIYVSTIA